MVLLSTGACPVIPVAPVERAVARPAGAVFCVPCISQLLNR